MQTYSINIGTSTESISYNLADQFQFNDILEGLKDNNSGKINPIDIRNSVLSLWSNSAFKETTNGDEKYIGIDTLNPNNSDLKYKLLIGKRSFNKNDIFTEDMNLSDSDIFFYETKEDFNFNGENKISILSGSDPSLFNKSPYLSSQYLLDLNSITFNIVNTDGDILIKSNINENISINGVELPSLSDNINEISLNNKVLKYDDVQEKLIWHQINYQVSDIDVSNQTLNLDGQLLVNGYALDFTDNRKVPVNISDVSQGESFSSYSITELLKRLVYKYQGPTGRLNILPPFDEGFIEVGTTPNIDISFTIDKKTNPTLTTVLQNMVPNTQPPITSSTFKTISGTASAIISPSPAVPGTQTFTIITTDGIETNSSSVSLEVIYPIFYGIGINNSLTYSGMNFLIKLLKDKSDKELEFLGNGNIFFLYPVEYGNLSEILDQNGNNIISDFSITNFAFSSPTGNFASKLYYIYESNTNYNISNTTLYTFKF